MKGMYVSKSKGSQTVCFLQQVCIWIWDIVRMIFQWAFLTGIWALMGAWEQPEVIWNERVMTASLQSVTTLVVLSTIAHMVKEVFKHG